MTVAYATQADVEAAIGVDMLLTISDRDHTGTVDPSVVTRALAESSSLARTYLPADPSPVPEVLRRITVDIAIHKLRIGTDNTTEDSRLAYDQAIKWLERVAAGTVVVPGMPVPEPDGVIDPGDPVMEADARIWSRATGIGCF